MAQKGAIRLMLRLGLRSSSREGFKKLNILTVPLYLYLCLEVICC
jgi:hypothetical protein